MTDLDMGDTAMEGNFPDDIFRFPNLQILNLKLNRQLTGYLPKSNWNSSLRKLDISLSIFLGEIPYSIGNLFFLKVLHIGFCNFTGSILTSIGNLTRATEIVFASNHFTGQLPYHVSELSYLTTLDLSGNYFEGRVPSWLFTLPSLISINLAWNKLNGPIDPFQWPNSLRDVRLEENEIRELHPWMNITTLDMRNNRIQGSILVPPPSTEVFLVSNNKLSGRIPPSICSLSFLQYLSLSDNNLSGTIPPCLGNFSTELITLHLKNNSHRITTPCANLGIGGFTPAKPPASLIHFCERSYRRSSERLDMDVPRNDALREDNEAVETITLREIANEAQERMMQDRLERMEKQMETLATILLRRRKVEEIPPLADQPDGVHPHRSTGRVPRERVDEVRDQPRPGRVLEADGRGASVEEGELRQRLQNAEQERDQIAARDPDRAVELDGEVRRLAQVTEEIQGKRKPPSWRIMLDEESPLSTEIMGTIIPRDFRFPDLKYSGRSDPLVHIECFNNITGVQGLTSAQRCRVFPLTLEGRAREWYRKLSRGSIRGYEQICQELAEQFRGAVAPEDDMMELMRMKQEEQEPLRDFVKRYHRATLDLGAFNHPQALRGLKEGVRIGRLWYNLRSPLVQNYSVGYEQAKRDIEIEEEKLARIKSEQLEELRRKEMRTPSGSGSGKRAGESSMMDAVSARSRPYPMAQRP
ncbi:Receptor-like protein 18 [Citrus sinensis]|nr:Receptor-like protein 18 [Citrus sinensis]